MQKTAVNCKPVNSSDKKKLGLLEGNPSFLFYILIK